MTDVQTPEPPSRLWRSACIGLIIGVVAFGVRNHFRPAPADPIPVNVWQVRQPATPTPRADPRLDRVLDTVDFDNATIAEVLESLSRRAGLNLSATWHEPTHEGVDIMKRLTLHLKHVHVRQALDEAARLCGDEHVIWYERGGVVFVTSKLLDDQGQVVVVYDILPLLQQGELLDKNLVYASSNMSPAQSGPLPPTSNASQQVQAPPHPLSEIERADEIKGIITMSVDPLSWKDNAGSVGSIYYWSGRLIVTQTPHAQDKIAGLLAAMRRGR